MATVSESSPAGPERLSGAARRLREELFGQEMLERLLSRADEEGVRLTGEGGFLPEMIKAVLEHGLDAELTDHLGYERGDAAGRGSPNSRNGSTPKTVSSEIGEFGLDVPRDRSSSFEPHLVPKGQRRLGGLDEMVISLYAGGMTVRDIRHHLARTLGTDLSHETISNVTDAVAEEVKEWQSRPLDALYPIVYLDALVVKVKDAHAVRNKAAHIAVGVDTDGDVRGLVPHRVRVLDLHHQRVEVDDRIERVQRPGLPLLELLGDRLGDVGDRLVGQVGAQRPSQVVTDVAHRHPARIQRDDHLVQAAEPALTLGHQMRLEGRRPVPRNVQPELPDLAGDGLGGAAIA